MNVSSAASSHTTPEVRPANPATVQRSRANAAAQKAATEWRREETAARAGRADRSADNDRQEARMRAEAARQTAPTRERVGSTLNVKA